MAEFGDFLRQIGDDLQSQTRASHGTPSAIQEYMYFNSLPDDQKQAYLGVKRAQQVVNLGGTQGVLSPLPGAGLAQEFAVTPKPEQMPQFQGKQEKEKVLQKAAAEKQVAAPAVISSIDNSIKVVDDALSHKGFNANFGLTGVRPNIPGGEAADAATYINQIRGKAFLTAIGEMKGSGAISEKEGDAATAAVARLDSAQSPESARKAMEELKGIMRAAKERAQAAGSVGGSGELPAETKTISGITYKKINGQWYQE